MRICRFDHDKLGLVQGDEVLDVSAALAVLPATRWPVPQCDPLIAAFPEVLKRVAELASNAPRLPLESVTLNSPVSYATKLPAAPVNYLKHMAEAQGDPETFHAHHLKKIEEVGLFLKASSSLVGAGDGVALRHLDRRNDHELELAVVIGKRADRVSEAAALDYVAGYAIGLDMTVRGPEERSLRKSIDSYSVLGPWIVTPDEVGNPSALEIELFVNDGLRQRANTRDLVIGIPKLIAWASEYYTLLPGDVIFTGTPDGVGPVVPGDVIRARIENIGEMEVKVRAA